MTTTLRTELGSGTLGQARFSIFHIHQNGCNVRAFYALQWEPHTPFRLSVYDVEPPFWQTKQNKTKQHKTSTHADSFTPQAQR